MRAPEQHISENAGEWHISSLIVQHKLEASGPTEHALTDMSGVEVHGRNDQGKMIVVVEAASERALVQKIDDIRQLDGVVDASLVYHQIDE
jgi:nitrate reductase NapD